MRAGLATLCVLLAGCTESRERWNDAHQLTGGGTARGALVITYYGCPSCHTIPGIREATATVGPPLTLIGRRSYLAGVLPNEVSNMEHWIRKPQEVHPGTAMPDLNMTPRDARDITAYLYTLR